MTWFSGGEEGGSFGQKITNLYVKLDEVAILIFCDLNLYL